MKKKKSLIKKFILKVFKFKNLNFSFLFILLILLVVTWKLTFFQRGPSKHTKSIIKKDIKSIILESLEQNVLQLKNAEIQNISIRKLSNEILEVHFSYSYKDEAKNETAKIQIQGKAKIKKNKNLNSSKKIWVVKDFHILENEMSFEKGLTINN